MIFFNKIKSTEAIEKERLQLWNDFQTYQEVEKSTDLKTYLALKEKVESKPFHEHKKEVESLRYKGSPEEKMQKQFEKLEKNSRLNLFFSTRESADLERFQTIAKSGVLNSLKELEAFVKGGGFKAEMNAFKRKKKADRQNTEVWEKTEAYLKNKQYDDLRTSPNVVFYTQFAKSKAYKNYLAVTDSSLLNQFEALKAEVESEKFKERKTYLENLKRYEDTEDFKLLTQFQQLDKDLKIQLYLKYRHTDSFKFFREWTLTFQDHFDTIDPKIWSHITPIALKGPGKNFSIKNQLHYANNDKNFDVENGILTLETKKKDVEGLYWDTHYGFVPRTFSYTSGLMHTVDTFMQEYGLFEVKVKASKVKGVLSSVSLVDENEEICIRIYSSNNSELTGGVITTNHQDKLFTHVPLKYKSKGYFLVQLRWTPEKLEWFINEKPVGSMVNNVPHIPLGIRIESEVLNESNNLPHRLDIDWVKCYKQTK